MNNLNFSGGESGSLFPIFLLFVIDIGFDRTAYRWFQEASGDRPKSPHWLTIHKGF
jgi:hypothetical protein